MLMTDATKDSDIILIFSLTKSYRECKIKLYKLGGIAQLGERLTGSQEVRGSSPLISTIILGQKRCHAVKAAWHKTFLEVKPPFFKLQI